MHEGEPRQWASHSTLADDGVQRLCGMLTSRVAAGLQTARNRKSPPLRRATLSRRSAPSTHAPWVTRPLAAVRHPWVVGLAVLMRARLPWLSALVCQKWIQQYNNNRILRLWTCMGLQIAYACLPIASLGDKRREGLKPHEYAVTLVGDMCVLLRMANGSTAEVPQGTISR